MKKARREAGRSPLVGHTHRVSRPRAAGCPRDGHTPARIAVRSADNFLVVIEADTGEEVFRVRDDQLGGIELGHVAFSSDGSKLASSEPNGDSTMVWDASTGHLLEAVTGEANPVKDGRVRNAHAVDTYGDGVTLWDVTTDVPVLPPAERVDWTDQFAFSPDGALGETSGSLTGLQTGSSPRQAMMWTCLLWPSARTVLLSSPVPAMG